MVKRVFRGLFLDKIAAVDRPCQEPAIAVLVKRAEDPETFFKRKFNAQQRQDAIDSGAALPDGSFPILDAEDLENAIHLAGHSKEPAKAKAHIRSRAKTLGLTDKLPDTWKMFALAKAARAELAKSGILATPDDMDEGAETFNEVMDAQQMSAALWDGFYKASDALRESICSILKDEGDGDKAALIQETIKQFADYVQGIIPGAVGKSLSDELARAITGRAGSLLKGDNQMSDALKKALKLGAAATDADINKAVSDLVAKADGRVEKMSEKHNAFMNHKDAKLPKGGKDAFQEMTAGERDKHIDDNPIEEESDEKVEKALKSGDAFKSADGSVFYKRDFGTDTAYAFAKSSAAREIAMAADIAKRDETEAVANFAKRAEEIGQNPDFGVVMRKAYKGDADAQFKLENVMQALVKQVNEGHLFQTYGTRTVKGGSATAEFNAKVEEVSKANPKLKAAQAFSKVYADPANADLKKRYDAEQRGA